MIQYPHSPYGGQSKRAYLDELLAQFELLKLQAKPQHAPVVDRIQNLIDDIALRKAEAIPFWRIGKRFSTWVGLRKPYGLRWRDIAAIELLLAELEADDAVEYRLRIIEDRLRQFLSAEEYARLVEGARAGAPDSPASHRRMRLQALIALLHFQIDLKSKLENLRQLLGTGSIVFAMLVLATGVYLTWTELDHASREAEAAVAEHRAPAGTNLPNDRKSSEKIVPNSPTDLIGVAGRGQVFLRWTDRSRIETQFKIERRVGSGDWTLIGLVPQGTNTFTDLEVAVEKRHEYRVLAANDTATANPTPIAGVLPRAYVTTGVFPIFPFVLLMGALGGFIGMQRRLRQPETTPLLVSTLELERGKVVTALSPAFGAVFALILYLVFAGRLLEGDFFPQIFPGEASYVPPTGMTSFGQFLLLAHPLQPTDVAKVLIWSFVAGFAERLVPDTLDRIAARQQGVTPGSEAATGRVLTHPAGPDNRNERPPAGNGVTVAGAETEVAADPTLTPPVASILPPDGTIQPDTTIDVRFTEPATEAHYALTLVGEEPIELLEAVGEDQRRLALRPARPLAAGTYEFLLATVVVREGAAVDVNVVRSYEVP